MESKLYGFTAYLIVIVMVNTSFAVTCPDGLVPLESLFNNNDFRETLTDTTVDPTLALSGSSTSISFHFSETYTITRFNTSWIFTFYDLKLQMKNGQAVTIRIYFRGDSVPKIFTTFPTDINKFMELTLKDQNNGEITTAERLELTFIGSQSIPVSIRELSISACGVDPNCYFAGDGYLDFIISFHNPASTNNKPTNPYNLLRGTGKQVFTYDYNLVAILKGGGIFTVVQITFIAISLGSASIRANDKTGANIYTGTFSSSGEFDPKTFIHSTTISNVGELIIEFTPAPVWPTASIEGLYIDACPQDIVTTTVELTSTEFTSQSQFDTTTAIETELSSYATTPVTQGCASGLAVLESKYSDLDFDVYIDNDDTGIDAKLALYGSSTYLTIETNNTFHVNRSLLGIPYTVMEVRLEVRGANSVISGALNNVGYISEKITFSSPLQWTSIKLTVEDGGFPNIREVILEWDGPSRIDVANIYVLACKRI